MAALCQLSHARNRLLLFTCCVAGAIGWLWWNCARNPQINFLPNFHEAEWIVYPTPPDAGIHRMAELGCEFRRKFVMNHTASDGTLRFCAFKKCSISVNGTILNHSGESWKQPQTTEVHLRAGTNEVSVTGVESERSAVAVVTR